MPRYLRMIVRALVITACVLMAGNLPRSSAYAAELPEEALEPVTYKGPDGMLLTIVALRRSGEKEQALVMLEGHPSFGKAKTFLTNVHESDRTVIYEAFLLEPARGIATKETSRWGGASILVPKISSRGDYRFNYPEKVKEQQLLKKDGSKIIKEYFSATSGVQGEILQAAKTLGSNAQASLKKNCNKELPLAVTADTFPAEITKNYDVIKMCADAVRGIELVCADELGREAIQEQVKSLECRSAENFDVSLKNGHVSIAIAPNTGELDTRVQKYLFGEL